MVDVVLLKSSNLEGIVVSIFSRLRFFFDVVVVVVVVVSKIAFDVKTTKRVLDERTAFLFRTKSEFPEAFGMKQQDSRIAHFPKEKK